MQLCSLIHETCSYMYTDNHQYLEFKGARLYYQAIPGIPHQNIITTLPPPYLAFSLLLVESVFIDKIIDK